MIGARKAINSVITITTAFILKTKIFLYHTKIVMRPAQEFQNIKTIKYVGSSNKRFHIELNDKNISS